MKRQFNSTIFRAFLGVFFIGYILACKKSDPNQGLNAPRIFSPLGISIKTQQSSAKITWNIPLLSGAAKLSYKTEFSQDSTFASSEFSLNSDTAGLVVGDDKIQVRKKYYLRVKALAEGYPESNWVVSSSFRLTGEQLFYPVRELEIKETEVTLRWIATTGLDRIVLQTEGGSAINHTISPTEASSGISILSGLVPEKKYTAELFSAARSRGFLEFTTSPVTVYTTILSSGADLVAAINAAGNNAVIGLNPGVYSAGSSTFNIIQKNIKIKSTSGNPLNTKINFREFTLKGTGAGINLEGIELDGTPSGSLYFLNFTGVAVDAEKCDYKDVVINNCIVHGATTSFLRANRGSNAGDYKIDQITVRNSLVYEIGSALNYICFHLDKLEFKGLNIVKSTFYNFGQALLTCSTVINAPIALVNIDYSTFNNAGANGRYVLMDANANPVRFSMTNSILANVPRSLGTVNAVMLRATGAGSSTVFSNNNLFNLTTNGTGATLTLPTANITQMANQAINLGWGLNQQDFTLPLASPLRTASSTSAPIGDPRWTY